jgi:hypothetical protein
VFRAQKPRAVAKDAAFFVEAKTEPSRVGVAEVIAAAGAQHSPFAAAEFAVKT